MTIAEALSGGTKTLQSADINSARLDCLVLFSDLLQKEKSWILAHDETALTKTQQAEFERKLSLRGQRQPLAYIRGRQEFYGHKFIVTPDVLIPRPETESLVELLADLNPQPNQRLIDVGTGSGAIAISCKLRWPELNVFATDISPAALKIATQNAKKLNAKINWQKSNLLKDSLLTDWDFVIANLPYVDPVWQRSPETNFEPALALFADDHGLSLIKKLLTQAKTVLKTGGHILLEADPRQMQAIEDYAKNLGYQKISSRDFTLVLKLT